MPVDLRHSQYLDNEALWSRCRDVLAGEDAIKARSTTYLPRLENQTEEDYRAYLGRACFYNATGRTHETLMGLVFRHAGRLDLPAEGTPLGAALRSFLRDVDLIGTSFDGLARWVMGEVLAVGRCGVLVDWGIEEGNRAAAVMYRAEDILNWRVERVNGKNELTMVVLREFVEGAAAPGADFFASRQEERLRVVRLENIEGAWRVAVDLWHPLKTKDGQVEWELRESVIPLRTGRPLERLPFVFCGSEYNRAAVGRVPLAHLMAVNLDHYRLDADYKHGLHYTALPTAWVAGMESKDGLAIGSRTAWMLDNKDARVGFLEFTGQGLQSFERALDRDERLMGVMGSRLLETQKRAYESAQTIELRQTAEHSALGAMALAASEALTAVLRWVCWWHGSDARPDSYGDEVVHFQLAEDYTPLSMQGPEVKALVDAWTAGAITDEQLMEALKRGEVVVSGEAARGIGSERDLNRGDAERG